MSIIKIIIINQCKSNNSEYNKNWNNFVDTNILRVMTNFQSPSHEVIFE